MGVMGVKFGTSLNRPMDEKSLVMWWNAIAILECNSWSYYPFYATFIQKYT